MILTVSNLIRVLDDYGICNGRIRKPPTTDGIPITDNRPPTHRPTDHRPPTYRQVFNRTTSCRPETHRRTDSPITDLPNQLFTNPLTHQTYLNRVTTGPILSLINFNSSLRLGAIYLVVKL